MVILTSTDSIEAVTTSTSAIDVVASFVDIDTTTFTPIPSQASITTATTTTIVAAPSGGFQRQLKYLSLVNTGAAFNSVSLQLDVSGTNRVLVMPVTLNPGDRIVYTPDTGFRVFNADGGGREARRTIRNGILFHGYKTGTAAEAAGSWYSFAKDVGNPGAYSFTAPGLAGITLDNTVEGTIPLWTPTTKIHINQFAGYATSGCMFCLWDWLWTNSGIVVTTTGAQTVNSVTLPARDLNDSADGVGVFAALLVTTATTNAGAITNTTLSYTNSDGVAGRVATMPSYPATAVVGTVVPFLLQAGDLGIQSIQSITLGTSRVAGAVRLIMYRPVISTYLQNTSVVAPVRDASGVPVLGTAALFPVMLATGTAAVSVNYTAQFIEE